LVKKTYFKVLERYSFLGEERYRVAISGTNIVFNVRASSEEEAIDKANALAEKMGLTDEAIEVLRNRFKEHTS